MFSTPAVPCGIVQPPIENLYPSLNNPLLYNAVQQQQRPVPQHLLFSPQLVHMKSAYYNTTAAATVVKEGEDESEKDRRLLIDFLLNQQDSRAASSRYNNTTRQPPTYPGEGDEDYQDVGPSVTNLAPPPFNLFSSPHNSHHNSCNDLPCYSSISNHNNHCNNNYGTKHDLVLPTFNGKKTRRRLTHEELYLLESVYTHNQTPDSFTKIELSKMLCMSPQQVSNWYVPVPFFKSSSSSSSSSSLFIFFFLFLYSIYRQDFLFILFSFFTSLHFLFLARFFFPFPCEKRFVLPVFSLITCNRFQNRRSKNRKALQYRNAKRLKMEQKLKSQPQLQLQQH